MYKWLFLIMITPMILSSCGYFNSGQLNNVGLLLEGTIHDETWGRGAYLGSLNIKEEQNVSALLRENIDTHREAEEAVQDFASQGVNLVFGHGENFGRMFEQMNEYHPDIQFIYFNGQIFDRNITSVNFDGYHMGFFSGMLAAEMTETNQIGVIAAYHHQDEVQGFYEGIQAVDSSINTIINSVNSWHDQQRAMMMFDQLLDQGIDVIYPAGDGFNVPVIRAAEQHGIYAIGYIHDQYDVAPETVITSTVQEVEGLYSEIAQMYNEGTLPSGIMNISFDQEYIYLGEYGDDVPIHLAAHIDEMIEQYIDTGRLPQ
ncbi:transcriptional activator of comK gene [Alkalibacillus filiformis]|uniref:Transcriptional activator of comK protein n=1 Tax=Alkalibacillus filiformis TaxID=200990 RepID=A0ABU0DTH8_9BACI|nr:BMP family ABC transporter substrate-binding protein [Alkalibacillus filiformis]MDQ0351767.1 transcriptional activator of comK gene [Alkalibacillus filiformis]